MYIYYSYRINILITIVTAYLRIGFHKAIKQRNKKAHIRNNIIDKFTRNKFGKKFEHINYIITRTSIPSNKILYKLQLVIKVFI